MRAKRIFLMGMIGLVFISCGRKKIDPAFLGKIERDQISVVTKVPGTVAEILVFEGDHVKKGDTLAILDMPEVDAKREQAQGAVKSAEAQYQMAVKGATEGQLRQLENKVDGLREQYEFAKKSKDRLEEMLKDSLIPQQKFDEVWAKFQGARNQYEAARTELQEAREGARVEQQTMALGQQLRASGALLEVGAAEREKYMIAPQDMSIETINLKTGELALPGYPIFSGYIDSSVYFRFTIPEEELGDVARGDKVEVQLKYKTADPIQGKISSIKALSAYANIATAYPDFDMEQALFEVHVRPEDEEKVKSLITRGTVSLEFKK